MHTVIITDRRTTPLFAEFKRMFAPFLTDRGGSICQCTWDETGDNIEQAVPDLYKSIRGHPEWRAIILVHPAQNGSFDPHNPFDFACNHKKELPTKEKDDSNNKPPIEEKDDPNNELLTRKNHVPLICLTHMLAGLPSLGVKEYKMCYACYNYKSCKYTECPLYKERTLSVNQFEELSKSEKAKLRRRCGDLQPRFMEESYSDKEKEDYKRLTKQYALKENRPVEVLILATREISESDDREATREAIRHVWEFYNEVESSDFWIIYPNTCRFLCYDLINPEHTLYKGELWRFFLLVLTLAVNQIPGQVLQAYRLYKADLKINTDELGYLFNEYIENLLSVQMLIQERLLRLPELTQEKRKELVPIQHISVKFEDVDEGDVMADGEKLGLSSDCPIMEKKFWHEFIQGTKQTIDNILSAPQEIVADKALGTRHKAYDFTGREQVLDRFQIERIHKRIDEMEEQVINANVYGILDTDAYQAEVAEAGDTVSKQMGLRLTKRNVLLISLCSLFTYLCGYIPYLINSAKISREVLGGSFGLTAVALILLAAGGLLTLWFLRRRLMKKIKTYNRTVREIFNRVNNGSQVYSNYFSSVCTYMYARSLLSGVILKQDNHYTERKIQKAHLFSIESEIKNTKELCSIYGLPVNDATTASAYTDVADVFLTEMPSASQIYELTPNKTKNTLELENIGETLDAPYNFVAGISIVREEIYNKGA